ncbi:MAG: iron-sulfur cluster assembly accessory protein [Pseudomonadota bacterium]
MFRITQNAARQVRIAAQQGGMEGMSLRLAACTLPDRAIDYHMGFDEIGEDDIRFNAEGVEIVMAPEFAPLLDQAILDYVEFEAGEQRFIFLNPRDPNYQPPTEN